jgi:SAM-dependent methyltransferase
MAATGQDKIWTYYQGEASHVFGGAAPRLDYVMRRATRHLTRSNARVLTIGVGNGRLERSMARCGWAISALDPDPAAIERLAGEGIEGKVGRLEALPYPADSFDVVIASEVLEHLDPEGGRAGLSEVERVLAPGGWFLGTVPYAEDLRLHVVVCPECGSRFHRWGHHRAFDEEVLTAELAGTFAVVRVRRRAFVAFRGRSIAGKGKSAVRWILGLLGQQIAAPSLIFEAQARH